MIRSNFPFGLGDFALAQRIFLLRLIARGRIRYAGVGVPRNASWMSSLHLRKIKVPVEWFFSASSAWGRARNGLGERGNALRLNDVRHRLGPYWTGGLDALTNGCSRPTSALPLFHPSQLCVFHVSATPLCHFPTLPFKFLSPLAPRPFVCE